MTDDCLIDTYKFGIIVIDGKRYTKDVLVFPEKVLSGWRRKEGHNLCFEDLEAALTSEKELDVLVIGTGNFGYMKVSTEVRERLRSEGVELFIQPTEQACHTYNLQVESGRRAVAALHLTC